MSMNSLQEESLPKKGGHQGHHAFNTIINSSSFKAKETSKFQEKVMRFIFVFTPYTLRV